MDWLGDWWRTLLRSMSWFRARSCFRPRPPLISLHSWTDLSSGPRRWPQDQIRNDSNGSFGFSGTRAASCIAACINMGSHTEAGILIIGWIDVKNLFLAE